MQRYKEFAKIKRETKCFFHKKTFNLQGKDKNWREYRQTYVTFSLGVPPPRGDARKPFLRARVYAKNTPKNYTYPALTDLIAWYLVRLIVYSLYSQPSTSDGLARCECPCFQQDDFTFRKIVFAFRKIVFAFSKIVFTICAEKVCYKPCNACYKLSNTCYKLCNAYYKLCNKNCLIGKEKLSGRKEKISCWKEKLLAW